MSDAKKTEASEATVLPPTLAADRTAAPGKPAGGETKKPSVLPTFLTPRPPQAVASPDGTVTVLLSSADNGGAFGLVEITSPPFVGELPQIHAKEDKTFYVVAGNGEFQLGDKRLICTAGSVIFAPRGTAHGYRSVGTAPLRVLIVYSPGGFEKIFHDIDVAGIAFGSAAMRALLPNYDVTRVPL